MEDGEIRAELKRIEQRFIDSEKTHELEARLLKEQLLEYKEMVRAKHSEMNEVRKQINEERGQFETREHAESQIRGTQDRVARIEAGYSGLNGRMIGLGMGLTVIMFLMELVFKFWPK